MRLEDLKHKKIGILGHGIEGTAAAEYLQQHGLRFEIFDQSAEVRRAGKDIKDFSAIGEADVLFRSPGIPPHHPAVVSARERGAEITSQIKYFLQNCPAKVIGVTGTKGKGTTAKLVYEILQAAGMRAFLAGNIGAPAIGLLDQLGKNDYVVLELSSFQLADVDVSPYISVVLMTVPEHLDYHPDEEEYIRAKSAVTRFQKEDDFAVINSDYPLSMQIGKWGAAKKNYVQTLPAEALDSDPFTIYKPERYLKIKEGVFAEQLHGNIYIVRNGNLTHFAETGSFPLRGFHNIQNICAAIAVAKILDVRDQVVLDAISAYKGLEHRLEYVCAWDGVEFYNDSIGTTPESSIAAIKAFTQPEVVIVGGVNKGVDYRKFAKELSRQKNLKALILIGQIAPLIADYLRTEKFTGKILEGAQNMREIFAQIRQIAEPGDAVLLAPGSASFGMFKDYKDRGSQFKEQALAYAEK